MVRTCQSNSGSQRSSAVLYSEWKLELKRVETNVETEAETEAEKAGTGVGEPEPKPGSKS
jgi:hypothetical protein